MVVRKLVSATGAFLGYEKFCQDCQAVTAHMECPDGYAHLHCEECGSADFPLEVEE